jgi:ketosteroid isomerase-like protein
MVAAERAFSKMSVEKGFKASFLAYIADDGVMFAPTPVNGKERLAARPDPPIELVWWPAHAEIASSGDLGWTTGPWERRAKGGGDQVLTGHFLTVWKKQADGSWRWVADTGVEHPKPERPAGVPPPLEAKMPRQRAGQADVATATQALLEADRRLGEAMSKGTAAAYRHHLAEDARLLRNGSFPFLGKEAVLTALERSPSLPGPAPEGGGVSAAGDLGYTYGTAEWPGGETPSRSGYLRIWERRDGVWKLVADWLGEPPAPPSSPN